MRSSQPDSNRHRNQRGPVEADIHRKLEQAFAPTHLEVLNESHMHSVPPGSESHFKVVLVSEALADLRKVARHQRIYGILAAELAGPVHALALHLYTPDEWASRTAAPESPACMGGSRHDQ